MSLAWAGLGLVLNSDNNTELWQKLCYVSEVRKLYNKVRQHLWQQAPESISSL